MIDSPRYSVNQAFAFGEAVEPRAWWLYDGLARMARFDNPSDAEYIATLLNLTTTDQRSAALESEAA